MKLLNLAVAAAFLSALVALTGCESPESVFGRFDADGNEVWRCSGSTSQVDHIVLTRHLLNDRDIGTGTVRAAGVTHRTVFRVAGVQRRWDWDLDGSAYRYSFIIDADGRALFYDFGSSDRPKGFYKCY